MQIKFNINGDSEAEFHPETLRILYERGDVVALDWLRDVMYVCELLYAEIHCKVFRPTEADTVQ